MSRCIRTPAHICGIATPSNSLDAWYKVRAGCLPMTPHPFILLSVVATCVLGCSDLGEKFGCGDDTDCLGARTCRSGLCIVTCEPEQCADSVCNPLGGCQAGVDGDLCISRENCAGSRRCSPNLECQSGAAGDPCEVQDHCTSGHYCGVDGQCHLGATGDPCTSDPECLSGICGPLDRCQEGTAGDACGTEDDCTDALSCGASGTCVGCTGATSPCGSLAASECTNTVGCNLGEACSGTPPFCGFQDVQGECEVIDGCAWNGASCLGLPTLCTDYFSETPCVSQPGCAWVDSCRGEAVACSELTGSECAAQPGCALE
jgi:hypothetical protein